MPFYLDAFWLQTGLFAMSAAIGAIGLNLLTGATGQLSMGHAFFLAVGAYGYVYLASEDGPHVAGLGLPTPLAFIGAIVLAGRRGRPVQPHRRTAARRLPRHRVLALIFIGQHVLFNAEPVTGGFTAGTSRRWSWPGSASPTTPGWCCSTCRSARWSGCGSSPACC